MLFHLFKFRNLDGHLWDELSLLGSVLISLSLGATHSGRLAQSPREHLDSHGRDARCPRGSDGMGEWPERRHRSFSFRPLQASRYALTHPEVGSDGSPLISSVIGTKVGRTKFVCRTKGSSKLGLVSSERSCDRIWHGTSPTVPVGKLTSWNLSFQMIGTVAVGQRSR